MRSALQTCVLKAKRYRDIFDHFWKNEKTARMSAHLAYFIRHGALPNAFNNLLFLFCSREIWSAGGSGAWACSKGVPPGPILTYSNGDQIEQMLILLNDHNEAVMKILGLHQQTQEKKLLSLELKHIEETVRIFEETLSDHKLIYD